MRKPTDPLITDIARERQRLGLPLYVPEVVLSLAGDVDPHLTLPVGGLRALVKRSPRCLRPAPLVGNGRSQDGLAIGRRCCRLCEDRVGGLRKPHRGHASE